MHAFGPLDDGDVDALQELLESDPGYTERVTGYPPGPSDALSTLMMRPEGVAEPDKVVLGAWTGESLTGALDLVRGYPEAGCAFVGLLIVRGDAQGRGRGRALHEAGERWIAENWPDVRRLRLAVVATNAAVAAPFWERLGYRPTGETRPYRYDRLESEAVLYERPLTP